MCATGWARARKLVMMPAPRSRSSFSTMVPSMLRLLARPAPVRRRRRLRAARRVGRRSPSRFSRASKNACGPPRSHALRASARKGAVRKVLRAGRRRCGVCDERQRSACGALQPAVAPFLARLACADPSDTDARGPEGAGRGRARPRTGSPPPGPAASARDPTVRRTTATPCALSSTSTSTWAMVAVRSRTASPSSPKAHAADLQPVVRASAAGLPRERAQAPPPRFSTLACGELRSRIPRAGTGPWAPVRGHKRLVRPLSRCVGRAHRRKALRARVVRCPYPSTHLPPVLRRLAEL